MAAAWSTACSAWARRICSTFDELLDVSRRYLKRRVVTMKAGSAGVDAVPILGNTA